MVWRLRRGFPITLYKDQGDKSPNHQSKPPTKGQCSIGGGIVCDVRHLLAVGWYSGRSPNMLSNVWQSRRSENRPPPTKKKTNTDNLAPALACLLIPSRPSVETIYKPAEAIYKHAETICKHAQATCKHADTVFPRESYLIPWNRLSNTQALFATLRKQGSNQQGRHVSAMKSEIMRKTLKRSRAAALALILFPVASRLLKIILVWHLLCLPSR